MKITDKYIKSPLNYVGGKYKLLPQILPLFPSNINTFVDLFGGGFNVGCNINAERIIYNDICKQVVELLNNFYQKDFEIVHNQICNIISEYNLSRSDLYGYEYYNCNSNDGLGTYNKSGYIKLRDDYNSAPDYLRFYTLITCSFSNQIRFNSKGEFNMPYGKRDYNKSLQSKLKCFLNVINQKEIFFVVVHLKILISLYWIITTLFTATLHILAALLHITSLVVGQNRMNRPYLIFLMN